MTRRSFHHSMRLALLALCVATTAPGCARRSSQQVNAPALLSEPMAVTTAVIAHSVQGRPIECLRVGNGAIAVLLLATIHGDEPAGTPLLQWLTRQAATDPPWMRDRRLIIVPLTNPDGYAADRRGNARGIDLNRNFPASSFTSRRRHGSLPLSEPEARGVHDLILRERPQRIISLHQPLNCIDFDGDASALALAMSHAIAAPHRLPIRKLGAYPGSLGSFAGEDLGIPIITVEFPAAAHRLTDDELWSRYGGMLIAGIAFGG